MKEIKLTRGQVTIVDDEDYELACSVKWYAAWARNTRSFYAFRSPRLGKDGKYDSGLSLHQLLMDAPKGTQVDHINHDTLDNRRANLRLVTRHQNVHNSRPRKDSRTGVKGVSFKKTGKRPYHAQICHTFIGSYATLEEATDAYNKAARELHGDYAYQNELE